MPRQSTIDRKSRQITTRHRPEVPATTEAQINAAATSIAETASDAAVAAHVAESDPHTAYQKESEKGSANGYASLNASTKVPIAEIPTGATAATVCIGNDSRLSDSRPPNGAAGGVLAGTYPNPSFASDMATQAELEALVQITVTSIGGLYELTISVDALNNYRVHAIAGRDNAGAAYMGAFNYNLTGLFIASVSGADVQITQSSGSARTVKVRARKMYVA
jgi:hypothetical protein